MRDFCVTALQYITRRPRSELLARPIAELVEDLLFHLRAKPFLLVLDGLERVLAAYNRSDAAQLADDEAEASEGATGKLPTDCIRPADDELLGLLRTAAPSKILISSRLMPRALLNRMGQPVPGVRHLLLRGLDPRDAEQMLREAGVTGDAERMRRYLDEKFGCHPLLVEIVGGLVLNYMKAPGQFDRWVDDPAGGGAVNLADPDIKQRRTHILRLAFDGLDENTRELLTRIAMISSATTWEVVAALNPVLPPPLEELEAPTPPNALGDSYTDYWRRELVGTRTRNQRSEVERHIAERQRVRRERYEPARQAHADYLAEQAKYQQSAEVRGAEPWLNAALADLVRRGLLQRERGTANFDLHPVVRGYAVASLGAEARARTGKFVADYFAARPVPVWDTVMLLQDLAAPIQMVQTLNLAGQTSAAWEVTCGGLGSALFRLERHHEMLALLRPLFPRGWLHPPEGVADLTVVAAAAAISLKAIDRIDGATVQEVFGIQNEISRGVNAELSLRLTNHAATARQLQALARARRILDLAQAVAVAAADTRQIAWCELLLINCQRAQGALAEARTGWASLALRLAKENAYDTQVAAQAALTEAWLLFAEGTLTEDTLRALIGRVRDLRRLPHERGLLNLSGRLHLAYDRNAAAEADFARAIEMARATGLRDTESEAGRGLALVRLGRRADAEAAAASAEHDPPRAELAELYLELGETDKARLHAQAGYDWYRADGPPFTDHWNLQRCRAVLARLNEPVPDPPPFDPAKQEPIPFEADVLRLLREHEAKQKDKKT